MDKKEVLKIFGNNVKKQREKVGFSIEELAKKSNINKNYLAKIEKGIAMRITFLHCFKLASAMNINPERLVDSL